MPPRITVPVRVLPHAAGIALPHYATDGSSGCDLRAAVEEPVTIEPGGRFAVPTGLVLAIPEGYEGQVRARSGLALAHGIACLNAPGTVDSDYRGEVKVILANLGERPFEIRRGDRIAQMVFAPVARAGLDAAGEIPDSSRGPGGFGSSGVE